MHAFVSAKHDANSFAVPYLHLLLSHNDAYIKKSGYSFICC